MRWFAKISLAVLVILSTVLILTVLCNTGKKQTFRPDSPEDFNSVPGTDFFNKTSTPAESLERFANWDQPQTVAPDNNELIRKLRAAAAQVVSAILPPDSIIAADNQPQNSLQLINDHTALVCGTVIIPENKNRKEKRFFYQVQVIFLPDGSCEAFFPEFSSSTAGKN